MHLSPDENQSLREREGDDGAFRLSVHARALAILAEDAGQAYHVFEFMTIRRPGDLVHYLAQKLGSADHERSEYSS